MVVLRQDGFADPFVDSTDILRLQHEYADGLSRLLTMGFDACAIPVALFAPDDKIAYCNQAYRQMMGIPPEVQSFSEIIHHSHKTDTGVALSCDPDEWLQMAAKKRRARGHRSFEIDMADGRWYMVNESCVEDGWVWNFYTEITSLKSNERRLKIARDTARRDAETDPLTGIFNRRFGISELESQIKYSMHYASPLAIVIIDLDNFKMVNDTYGHLAGDAVLSHFAEKASWHVRRTDTFARYGGEEFLLIMPGTKSQDANIVVSRIREQTMLDLPEGVDKPYTFSAGIAQFQEVDDASSVIRRADAALYRAKKNGRNRTEIAPD